MVEIVCMNFSRHLKKRCSRRKSSCDSNFEISSLHFMTRIHFTECDPFFADFIILFKLFLAQIYGFWLWQFLQPIIVEYLRGRCDFFFFCVVLLWKTTPVSWLVPGSGATVHFRFVIVGKGMTNNNIDVIWTVFAIYLCTHSNCP